MRITLICALLTACGGEPLQGTAVGNPGNLDVSVGDVPDEITLDLAEVHAADLVLLGCAGEAAVVPIQSVLDGLGPSAVDIEMPGGSWCGALLTLDPAADGQVVLGGSTTGGTDFAIAMDPGSLPVHEDFLVDGNELLLVVSLGDVLDVAEIESRGATADIPADDAAAVGWSDLLSDRTGLYEDRDGNGVLTDADDFVAGAIGPGSDTGPFGDAAMAADAEASAGGCSCQTGSGWSWLWLLLPLVLRRRESPGMSG